MQIKGDVLDQKNTEGPLQKTTGANQPFGHHGSYLQVVGGDARLLQALLLRDQLALLAVPLGVLLVQGLLVRQLPLLVRRELGRAPRCP